MNKDRFYRTYPIFGCTLFLIAVLVPLCMALVPSFITSQGVTVQTIVSTFTDRACLMTLAFSTLLALLCTIACTLFGWLGASLLVRYSFAGSGLLKALFGFAILLPPSVSALGIRLLLGEGGYLNALYGIPAVTNGIALVACVFVIFYTPIATLFICYYWKRLDYRCEQAARTLGVTGSKAYRTITHPRLRPAIVAASALVFLACLTGFTAIQMLDAKDPCISAQIQIFRNLDDASVASCYAIFYIALGLVALGVFCPMQRKMSQRITADTTCHREPVQANGFLRNAIVVGYTILSVLLLLAPIVAIIANAVYDSSTGFAFQRFVELFNGMESMALMPLLYSLAIAVVGSLVATFIARAMGVSIYRKPNGKVSSGLLAMLPFAIGSLTLGFGFRNLDSYLPQIPAIAFVTLSHMVMLTPVTVILVSPVLSSMDKSLVPASRTLGFGANNTFKSIEKPALRPAMTAGFLLGLAISLGNTSNALVIAGSDAKTLPVLLLREYANANLGCASALACVLIVLCFIVVLIGERFIRKCHV